MSTSPVSSLFLGQGAFGPEHNYDSTLTEDLDECDDLQIEEVDVPEEEEVTYSNQYTGVAIQVKQHAENILEGAIKGYADLKNVQESTLKLLKRMQVSDDFKVDNDFIEKIENSFKEKDAQNKKVINYLSNELDSIKNLLSTSIRAKEVADLYYLRYNNGMFYRS
ncbi:MAG: hypothetical protein AAF443_05805 [Chlamydiota bacterium]